LLLVGQLLLQIGLVGVGELGEIEGGVHCGECKEYKRCVWRVECSD
jgi:hypothetical protein